MGCTAGHGRLWGRVGKQAICRRPTNLAATSAQTTATQSLSVRRPLFPRAGAGCIVILGHSSSPCHESCPWGACWGVLESQKMLAVHERTLAIPRNGSERGRVVLACCYARVA